MRPRTLRGMSMADTVLAVAGVDKVAAKLIRLSAVLSITGRSVISKVSS